MVAKIDVKDFTKGEDVTIQLLAKARGGAVIDTPGSQAITVIISDPFTKTHILEFTGAPQVVLFDEPNGDWTITLSDGDLSVLVADKAYDFNVWSASIGGEDLHQITGDMVLNKHSVPV